MDRFYDSLLKVLINANNYGIELMKLQSIDIWKAKRLMN